MFILYDLFFIIFSVLYLPYFLIKGKWRGFSRQRFGIFSKEALSELKGLNSIWIHAVSVGEVVAAVPLFEEIAKNYPGCKLVVSTVTPTGNSVALNRFKGRAAVIYLPLDLSFIVDKVVRIVKPKAVLIAETEIWPNFIKSAKLYGAKVILFNGRVSRSSYKGYKMIVPVLSSVLRRIDLFIMQSGPDAGKIVSLGAPADRVKVTGNLKYDAAFASNVKKETNAAALRQRFGLRATEKLLIAGSTHPGEEEVILRSYAVLAGKHPELRLLLAPRHVERAKGISCLCKAQGFDCRLISESGQINSLPGSKEVLILDIMGMLSEVYSTADLVFVGGSLINKGGQNPLEAAYHSKAILFGPYTHNFDGITEELVNAGAGLRVNDEHDLVIKVEQLLEDEDRRMQMGAKARALLDKNAGIAQRNMELIRPFLQ